MEKLDIGTPLTGTRLERVKTFLRANGLRWEGDPEITVTALDAGRITATASLDGNVLKYVAVSEEKREQGLTATVMSPLVQIAVQRGISPLFLFTKNENMELFLDLGFDLVAQTASTVLMESGSFGVRDFVQSIQDPRFSGIIGAVVANCNPFTLGHRYLIEQALKSCDWLYLFILSEDRSEFPANTRLLLAQQGVEDLKRVKVCHTGSYLVSSVTFPAYFHRDTADVEAINTELDLAIFAQCFAAPLGITRRFEGTEPECTVTRRYHQQMASTLPRYGIQVLEIPRLNAGQRAVSAGEVRRLMGERLWGDIEKLVPRTTMNYILKHYAETFNTTT